MNSKWSRFGVVALAVLLIAFFVAAVRQYPSQLPQPQNKLTNRSNLQTFPPTTRRNLFQTVAIAPRLYPYSIVAGGVGSNEELRVAIANDTVVARHYEGFDLATATIVALPKPMHAYVSYRIGEDVFWTRHKVNLPPGETLVSDGTRLARTRCGNRISETPQSPISAKEPASEVLEAALEPAFVNSPEDPITREPSFDHPVRAAESGAETSPTTPPFWWVPETPIVPVTPLPPVVPPIIPPENPPVNIPEPGTGTLLILGILLIGFVRNAAIIHRW
jgi:hypothetical protein